MSVVLLFFAFCFPLIWDTDLVLWLGNQKRYFIDIGRVDSGDDNDRRPWLDGINIKHHHLPVDDFTAAELPVIQKAINIIQEAEANNEKVGVHCQLGQGRAGTILACYLAFKNHWDGDRAIKELRRLRPKSIDFDQERAVRQYARSLQTH